MSDQEDEHYNETMQAAEHAIAQDIEQYELQIAKAFDRGYKKGLRDGKEEGVKAIEELMKTYNKNMGKFEESLTKIIKGE